STCSAATSGPDTGRPRSRGTRQRRSPPAPRASCSTRSSPPRPWPPSSPRPGPAASPGPSCSSTPAAPPPPWRRCRDLDASLRRNGRRRRAGVVCPPLRWANDSGLHAGGDMSADGPEFLGLGGRLEAAAGEDLVAAGFALEMADAKLLHDGFGLADLAHVLALADAGVLAGALLEMAAVPADEFPYDAAYGDPWNSRERWLEARAGARAGWLTVGRPRREAARVALRIAVRRAVLDTHAAAVALAEAYLAQARRHRTALMADFTYLQPAQPTTLGYMLAGHLQPVLRHLGRLERAYGWVNSSPAGAGGTTGSGLPLDRERLAARLGFAGVIPHARDAMWQTDGLVDLLATVAALSGEAGQVAADLEIWASPPFGFVT